MICLVDENLCRVKKGFIKPKIIFLLVAIVWSSYKQKIVVMYTIDRETRVKEASILTKLNLLENISLMRLTICIY